MARKNPPHCADCGRLILWAHLGEKDAFGTKWLKLDPGLRDASECIRAVPYEGQALHLCRSGLDRWHRAWSEAWTSIGTVANMSLRLERLETRGE